MTAMQITTGAVRQIRAGAGPRRLALAVWLAVAALGGAAFAQEGPGDGPESDAEAVAEDILQIVRDNWERTAARYDLTRRQIEEMRPAFNACYE